MSKPVMPLHTIDGGEEFQRPSSIIWKIRFAPAEGISVTFHEKGVPTLTRVYPGTTMADFDRFVYAGSVGQHWRLFYSQRASFLRPLDA